jgi:hypothetical protein
MMPTRSVLVLLLLVSALVSGCESETPIGPTPPASSVLRLLAPSSMSLAVGDTAQLRVVATLRDQPSEIVTTSGAWQSSNPGVADVDASGIVRGVSAGTADVMVTLDGVTATVAVAVSTTSGTVTTFWGTVAGANGATGTLTLTFDPSSRAIGTVYFAASAVSLIGRIDQPTGIVNVVGGGYTVLGTLGGQIIRGTFTDPAGATAGFAAIESTHTAVTPYCGSYTSGGATGAGNPDEGAFALAVAFDNQAAGASLPADASAPPLTFAGQRNGDALAMTTSLGAAVNGSVQGATITGSFQTADGSGANFTVSASACN